MYLLKNVIVFSLYLIQKNPQHKTNLCLFRCSCGKIVPWEKNKSILAFSLNTCSQIFFFHIASRSLCTKYLVVFFYGIFCGNC